MTEAEQIMKRCQAGTRNYEEANNLHAACYGIIGKLLAQPEQEPVLLQCTTCGTVYAEGVPPQVPEQEPVAAYLEVRRPNGPWQRYNLYSSVAVAEDAMRRIEGPPIEVRVLPLYTIPPKREWVGLTDEQWQIFADTLECFITRKQKDIIEAKLKEKNT